MKKLMDQKKCIEKNSSFYNPNKYASQELTARNKPVEVMKTDNSENQVEKLTSRLTRKMSPHSFRGTTTDNNYVFQGHADDESSSLAIFNKTQQFDNTNLCKYDQDAAINLGQSQLFNFTEKRITKML